MASAVGVASLVTVGGIALLQGSVPSLQILSLASTLGASSQTFAATATTGTMMIYERLQFSASPDLTAPTNAPAYKLKIPSNGGAELARLAGIFGVNGPIAASNGDDWAMTGSNQSTLWYQSSDGIGSWSFNALGTSPVTSVDGGVSSSTVPSDATVEADAQHLMGELGYDYTVGNPSSFSTQSITTTAAATFEKVVSYDVVVQGTPTDQTLQFAFDGSNDLVSASGPAFYVVSSTNYPLQAPLDAVATLNEQQARRFATHSGIAVQGAGATSPPDNGSPGSTGLTTPTAQVPPTVDATINAAALHLAAYRLADGTLWLVPEYLFTGDIDNAAGSTSPSSWNAIAVDPSYVHLSNPALGGITNY
jgi:hypothetical protein